MIQFIDGQDQSDIDMFEPTENFLQMVNQGSPAGVQTLFQHEFDSVGLLGNVPLGISTSIKNGALIAFPSPSSLSWLFIFFCQPTGIEELSAEELPRLQEQASHGKLQRDDIELMTKCKPFTPYNFSSFQHMLKNMTFLREYLGGPHCLAATAWRSAFQHAMMNKLAYREEQQKEKLFYVSILNDYHRRFQTFLRSSDPAPSPKPTVSNLTSSNSAMCTKPSTSPSLILSIVPSGSRNVKLNIKKPDTSRTLSVTRNANVTCKGVRAVNGS